MSILILIIFILLNSFAKLNFLFNFTFQSNLKFIWYLNFDPDSFNCYLLILLLNWFFFSISSLNIWLIENWVSCFFIQIWYFRSNDLGHEFEKLTRVFFFKKRLYNSLYFFYWVIQISWSGPRVWWDIPG
jgi:hypothetical protein